MTSKTKLPKIIDRQNANYVPKPTEVEIQDWREFEVPSEWFVSNLYFQSPAQIPEEYKNPYVKLLTNDNMSSVQFFSLPQGLAYFAVNLGYTDAGCARCIEYGKKRLVRRLQTSPLLSGKLDIPPEEEELPFIAAHAENQKWLSFTGGKELFPWKKFVDDGSFQVCCLDLNPERPFFGVLPVDNQDPAMIRCFAIPQEIAYYGYTHPGYQFDFVKHWAKRGEEGLRRGGLPSFMGTHKLLQAMIDFFLDYKAPQASQS